jgi:hypothetical protein
LIREFPTFSFDFHIVAGQGRPLKELDSGTPVWSKSHPATPQCLQATNI